MHSRRAGGGPLRQCLRIQPGRNDGLLLHQVRLQIGNSHRRDVNFFLGPWFCFQPCLPLPLWCGCSDEREGNVYINRGRQGRGTVMVIDEEMGTLGCYHCDDEAHPCCTCVKIGK